VNSCAWTCPWNSAVTTAAFSLIGEGQLAEAGRLVNDHWHDGIAVVTAWIEQMLENGVAQ